MRIEAVLLDLDQTLVDTAALHRFRSQGRWAEIYPRIPKLSPYPGMTEALIMLRPHVKVAVVTKSPSKYTRLVLSQLKIDADCCICYHDVPRGRQKPEPDQVLAAVNRLQVQPRNALVVGDSTEDILAGRAAGTWTAAAMWGCAEQQEIIAAEPDVLLTHPGQLVRFVLGG